MIKKFRKYLLGRKFSAYCDCSAVKHLLNKKETTGRIQRWILLLAEYDFEIKHIKGKDNLMAVTLSKNADELE